MNEKSSCDQNWAILPKTSSNRSYLGNYHYWQKCFGHLIIAPICSFSHLSGTPNTYAFMSTLSGTPNTYALMQLSFSAVHKIMQFEPYYSYGMIVDEIWTGLSIL